MKFLGILRASALFILVSAFHGPRGVFCSNLEIDLSNESFTVEVSEDHEDSTVESSSQESLPSSQSDLVFQRPSWHDSHLASAVFFLEEFCQEVRADAFSGRLVEDLYDGLKEPCLRVSYYARSYTDHFRPRNLLDGPYKDALKPEMFQHYVEWLVENIPGITGSLEDLSNEFKGLSEKQLESAISVVLTSYGFEFHDAWTDKDFMSSLRHKTSNLVNALKSLHGSLGKIHSDSFRNPLTEAQSNLVFQSSKWDDSHLASAVLFLKQFCKEVNAENFGGKVTNRVLYRGIKAVCRDCMLRLKLLSDYFTPTYGPGSVAERNEIPKNFYEDVLKPEKFEDYAEWLKGNIPGIIESLKNMHDEAVKLTEEQLKTDTSTGPLKYGFVYVYKGSWWSRPCYKNSLDAISQYCLAVMRSLAPMKHLLGCLDKNYGICPQESSSELSAPSSQSYLVFQSSEWDDSHLASAFLFIEEFCSLVNAENFGGNLKVLNDVKDNKDAQWLSVKVKSLCSNFSSRLESLSTNLVPSGVTVNPYEGVLKSDKFNTYAEWLVKNIPGIRESVQKMFNESKKLNKAQLKDTNSTGPSKYGFEFVGDKWKPFVYYNLKDLTWCLRATLEYLQETLDKILKDPQCENASIISKVLNFLSREKKSDVNSQQEDSTVKSQAV